MIDRTTSTASTVQSRTRNTGIAMVFAAAVVWSFGGAIARFLEVQDSWTIVFWRASFASSFLLLFLLWRDGFGGTIKLIAAMRLPAIAVALCFATGTTSFVVALAYTSVANILLMQAGAPLIAALMTWALFRERVSPSTGAAIAAVIAGVAVMVSGSLTGQISPIGDALSILIVVVFALATVLTRRFAHERMVPAAWLGTLISASVAASLASDYAVSARDLGLLFGALGLALGMALFVSGARLIPATLAALVSVSDLGMGPVWVWLVHGEVPAMRTLVGGGIVLAALILHVGWQFAAKQDSD